MYGCRLQSFVKYVCYLHAKVKVKPRGLCIHWGSRQLKGLRRKDWWLQSSARLQPCSGWPCQPCPLVETRTRCLQASQIRRAQGTLCPHADFQPSPVRWIITEMNINCNPMFFNRITSTLPISRFNSFTWNVAFVSLIFLNFSSSGFLATFPI